MSDGDNLADGSLAFFLGVPCCGLDFWLRLSMLAPKHGFKIFRIVSWNYLDRIYTNEEFISGLASHFVAVLLLFVLYMFVLLLCARTMSLACAPSHLCSFLRNSHICRLFRTGLSARWSAEFAVCGASSSGTPPWHLGIIGSWKRRYGLGVARWSVSSWWHWHLHLVAAIVLAVSLSLISRQGCSSNSNSRTDL